MIIDQTILSQCSSRADALHKIHAWAPKRTKSFKIKQLSRYRYGCSKGTRKNYFEFQVDYYSCLGGGDYLLKPDEWDWETYCLHKVRFPVYRTRSSRK